MEPCLSYTCKQCAKSVKVGETLFYSDDLYSCSVYSKRHKAIKAEDCGEFKCKNANSWPTFCKDCRGNQKR